MFENFDNLRQELPEEVREKAKNRAQEMHLQLTLTEIREQLNITQEELANKLHVKQSAISKMEKREGISLANLQKMIKAMGGEIEINIKFPNKDKNFKLNPSLSN